jgi:NADPH:quinone reductase-like Zn-dependent oxidoreductase
VKVLAAGVAYADILMRRGLYPGAPQFPFVPGYDIVGDVDAVGENVTGFAVDQRVAALTMTGGYSQYTVVEAAYLVPVPPELDPSEAVALVLNYVTAYQMLHRLTALRQDQRLLIHSAAGGVGTAALQLGKIAGLQMYGTASKAKHGLLASLGAAATIDYHSENFAQRMRQLAPDGVDCALDPIGGTHWWESYSCLRRAGTLVCYGVQAAISNGKTTAGLGFVLLGVMKMIPDGKRVAWYNVTKWRNTHPEWFRTDLTKLFELLAARKIQPVIAERLPLREAARANEMLEKSQITGKIVLLCQE